MSKDIFYDKDIREPLFDFLEDSFGKVRILEEKRTGSARADVVMITPDFLYGIGCVLIGAGTLIMVI